MFKAIESGRRECEHERRQKMRKIKINGVFRPWEEDRALLNSGGIH